MDLIHHDLLRQTQNSVFEIRKMYNLHDPQRLTEAIDILEEWVKKQAHFLKRDFSRGYYERTLITCKGSVEKAKKRIDKLCTLRSLVPKYYYPINVKKEISCLLKDRGIICLPNLTQDLHRALILQISSKDIKPEYYLQFYRYSIISCEYALRYEYTAGFIIIFDYRNVDVFESLPKMNFTELQQFMTITIEGYGARVKKVIILSESKYIELLIKTIKQFLSEKLNNRIQIATNIEELTTFVTKDILPKDYGGEESSADTLKERWIEAISSEDHIEHMKMISTAGTDESLRESEKWMQDWVGIPGSFRTLAVD